MVRCRLILLTLMISLCLCGCEGSVNFTDEDLGIYEKIHRYYSKMESYSAYVKMTVKSNKTENVYEMEQLSAGDKKITKIVSPEQLSRIMIITDGDDVQVIYSGSKEYKLSVPLSEDIDYSFVDNFMSLYYRSEETAVTTVAQEESGTTLLETELPLESARRRKASMLIDNKTLAPKNITVYDMGGNIVFIADFVKFVYNDNIKDEIFEIVS